MKNLCRNLSRVSTFSPANSVLLPSELEVASVDVYLAVGGSVTVVVVSGPGVVWAA
jgi:hypothetical protein